MHRLRRGGRNPRAPLRPGARTAFHLVHEDAHLVVVDKAAGILTVPAAGETRTLIGLVSRHLHRGGRGAPKLFVVHRLDRDTSGLLVIARTLAVARTLEAMFAAHDPERVYHAIVAGNVQPEAGTFRSHLATDSALNQRSTRDPHEGKLAVTHYRVTARLPGATAVEVRLETGRRNQIRVHFAEAGHPVLGDSRYGVKAAQHRHWPYRRLALHAAVLGFTHPVTGEALRFESPPPAEFSRILAAKGGVPAARNPAARKPAARKPSARKTGRHGKR